MARSAAAAKWVQAASRLDQKTISLPSSLVDSVRYVLASAGLTQKQLKADTKQLHDFLFGRQVVKAGSPDPQSNVTRYRPGLEYGAREGIAFLAGRLPVSYGATYRVLSELQMRDQNFQPSSILDFGSGIGTTDFVVRSLWNEGFGLFTNVESSLDMIAIHSLLRSNTDIVVNKHELFSHVQILPIQTNEPMYDLVVSSFSLSEIPEKRLRRKILHNLWAHTKGYLAIIESGNPQGFELVQEARNLLMKEGGSIFGPCSHKQGCPRYGTERPCHFPIRVEVPAIQRYSPVERAHGMREEKISYLVLSRDNDMAQIQPRIVAAPMKRGGHCIFELCTASEPSDSPCNKLGEIVRRTVPKSVGTSEWIDCKERAWGDLFPEYSKTFRAQTPQAK